MTREDIITNLRYWCNNIDKPCEECKIHDICVVRDHVQTFDSMDDYSGHNMYLCGKRDGFNECVQMLKENLESISEEQGHES